MHPPQNPEKSPPFPNFSCPALPAPVTGPLTTTYVSLHNNTTRPGRQLVPPPEAETDSEIEIFCLRHAHPTFLQTTHPFSPPNAHHSSPHFPLALGFVPREYPAQNAVIQIWRPRGMLAAAAATAAQCGRRRRPPPAVVRRGRWSSPPPRQPPHTHIGVGAPASYEKYCAHPIWIDYLGPGHACSLNPNQPGRRGAGKGYGGGRRRDGGGGTMSRAAATKKKKIIPKKALARCR